MRSLWLLVATLIPIPITSSGALAAEPRATGHVLASLDSAQVSTTLGPGGFSLVTFRSGVGQPIKRCAPECTAPQRARVASSSKAAIGSSFQRAVYLDHVRSAERRHALPSGLLDAVIWTESRYNPFALSKAGAAGLGQLMPRTAQALGVVNRYDPLRNIEGSAQYLRSMLDQFSAVHLAIAAYNAGPKAVRSSRGIPANGETMDYVHKVVQAWLRIVESHV